MWIWIRIYIFQGYKTIYNNNGNHSIKTKCNLYTEKYYNQNENQGTPGRGGGQEDLGTKQGNQKPNEQNRTILTTNTNLKHPATQTATQRHRPEGRGPNFRQRDTYQHILGAKFKKLSSYAECFHS